MPSMMPLMKSAFRLVSIQPGATALHRIPSCPWSTATARVRPCRPAFVAQSAAWAGLALRPSIDPIYTMEPWRSRKCGSAALISRNGA